MLLVGEHLRHSELVDALVELPLAILAAGSASVGRLGLARRLDDQHGAPRLIKSRQFQQSHFPVGSLQIGAYASSIIGIRSGGGGMRRFLAEHLGVFDPNDTRILVGAFDRAWEAVQASGVIFDKAKADSARAILAKHIIAVAKDGERDHGRLRDGALVALAQSNL